MSSSRCLSVVAAVLTAALLGCAHVPADNASSAGATARNGSQPPAAGSIAPASAAQAGTAVQTSASPSQGLEAPTAPPDVVSAQVVHDAAALGYRRETRNGVTIFCREETDLGSRFPTKQCVDQRAISILVEQQHQQQDLFRNTPAPLSSH
jgi:hypothetical protein